MSAGLGKLGVKAFKWSAVSTVARFGLQLIAQVILARMLGPANYGVFGIGMLVLTLSAFLSNFGFAWNLLHKADLHQIDIRFAFTWQVLIGIVTMAVMWLSASALAVYFNEPQVESVIRWLSLTCLINAAGSVSSNLLQRALNFRAIGIIQIASYALGYMVVGIGMALLGFGVHALVGAWLVQALVGLVGNYALERHSLRPLLRYPGMSSALNASGTVFLTNIVNWWVTNLDRVMLGRILDAHAVGLYAVGYNLATMPNTLLLGALQPSFMAAASRMQSEPERLAKAYLQMLATVWALALPAFAIMAVLSFDLIHLLYGDKWSGTATVLALLFLGMPAYVSWALSTPVLWNMQRKSHEYLTQLPVLALAVVAFFLLTRHGIQAVAATASLVLVGRMLVVAGSAFQVLKLRFSDLAPYIGRGMFLAAIGCAAAYGGSWLGNRAGSSLFGLLLGGALSGALLVGVVLARPSSIGRLPAQMLIRFFPRFETTVFKKMQVE